MSISKIEVSDYDLPERKEPKQTVSINDEDTKGVVELRDAETDTIKSYRVQPGVNTGVTLIDKTKRSSYENVYKRVPAKVRIEGPDVLVELMYNKGNPNELNEEIVIPKKDIRDLLAHLYNTK